MSAHSSGPTGGNGEAAETESPTKSAESSSLYVVPGQQLADEQFIEDCAADAVELPSWSVSLTPADRLPSAHEARMQTDGMTGRRYIVTPDGGEYDPDRRVELAISGHVAAASARHAAGRHEQATEHGCPACWVRTVQHRETSPAVLAIELDPASVRETIEARWRSHLLAGRRVAEDREIRPPVTSSTPTTDRMVTGSAFLADAETDDVQLWGDLWLSGEALVITGPPGVGKTTLAQQVVCQTIADEPAELLGEQVAPFDLVVYLAMDRPRQIARSLRRMLADVDPADLDERLVVWQGPPPADVAAEPTTLLDLVTRAAGGSLDGRRVAVIVDSLKDAAVGLVDDAVGAGYNRARQLVLAAGVEVIELHHMVKRGANGTRPTTLADVYGSAWITAGAGSVVLLWGDAGDPVVELRHLKQPREEVGPLRVLHDHARGVSTLTEGADLLALLRARSAGLSAKAAAGLLFGEEKPTTAQTEKARRRLDALVTAGHAYRHEALPGQPVVWTALTPTTVGGAA